MRKICSYGCEMDANRHPSLVKEKEFEYHTDVFTSPKSIVHLLNEIFHLNCQAEEYVYLIGFDVSGAPLGIFRVSQGTVNYAILRPREIYIRALAVGATNIVVAHNHPSGDVTPSGEDRDVITRLTETGKLMDIPLLDFLIVGNETYLSAREENLL